MSATEKVIRDPAFAKRLAQACDASFHCPGLNHGRMTWIRDELAKRFNEHISLETVSRWYHGVAKPRAKKNELLAQLLGVDSVWLYLGVDPDMTPREKKLRNAEADGAVNLVAGFIQMDGGFPAFPEEADARAQRDHIDLYAIIRGANYSLHVSVGQSVEGGWQFGLPTWTSDQPPLVLGIVRQGFSVRIFEITPAMMDENGERSGASRRVTLTEDVIEATKIESFANRL